MTRVTVWTVTTEGDNCPTETAAFGSLKAARAYLMLALTSWDVTEDLTKLSNQELAALWEETADGPCLFDAHQIEIGALV